MQNNVRRFREALMMTKAELARKAGISALTILGKEAVLYEYPYESHTPRAIENKLDMWARFIGWFDEHVKNAGAEHEVTSEEDEPGSHE